MAAKKTPVTETHLSRELEQKYDSLKRHIGQFGSAVIAFSGGVDSTFLARVGREVLGERLLLVTAASATYPARELEEAKRLAAGLGISHRIITSEEIDIPGFADNPPDRCYYCKSELFTEITRLARSGGYEAVFDGSNGDDTGDYRPGRRALREQGVLSPLLESGLGKEEIRMLSRRLGLPTAGKPSFACLASRFPYGEKITRSKLQRVDHAEKRIREMGFGQFRVRSHGDAARVELDPAEMERGWIARERIDEACRAAGFAYVALDLRGYRTGAMNEILPDEITS